MNALVHCSTILRRLPQLLLVAFVLFLGTYNWLELGKLDHIVKALIFALFFLAGDLIRALRALRDYVPTLQRGWRPQHSASTG